MPAMILVTGATGFIGRHTVPRLVDAGWPVRVLVPPGRGGTIHLPWPDHEVEPVVGSIYQPDDLSRAVQGVHTVFHLASAQWWGRPRDLQRVDVDFTQALIKASLAAHIGRLIVMSHLGAAPSSAFALLRAKGEMEDLVRRSGLPYTIIRSGVVFGEQDRFVNGLAMLLRTNPVVFFLPGQGETLLHPLYIHDLAAGLVQSMDNLDTVDRVLEVGGPEYVTFREMVKTIMRVTHAPRQLVSLPPYVLRWVTVLVSRVFPRWPMTTQWFDLLASHRTAGLSSMSEAFDIKPVRFEDTIVRYMAKRRFFPQMVRFLFRRRRPRGV